MAKTKTIGRDASNGVKLESPAVSHHHAEFIVEGNKYYIRDLGSTNGTYVNGTRITGKQQIRKGDKVVLANVPLEWEELIGGTVAGCKGGKDPEPTSKCKWCKWAVIAAAVVVIAAGAAFYVVEKNSVPSIFNVQPKDIYEHYQKSVVLISSMYTYEVTYNGEPLSEYLPGGYTGFDNVYLDENQDIKTGHNGGAGTGFFITGNGHILTNKHVVCPDDEEDENLKDQVRQILLGNRLKQLADGFKIKYKNLGISIAYNGVHLNDYRDMKPCTIYKLSENDKVDLAIIQLNDKVTPDGANYVDINKMSGNKDLSLGSELYSIGFPYTTVIGKTDFGIEANNQKGTVTQERDEYVYGNDVNVLPGASGSPVFDFKGRLCGIMVSGFVLSQGYNHAILPDVIGEFVSNNLKTVNIK